MARPTVLFVSHRRSQCGVHQFGCNVATALRASARYDFRYQECGGADDYRAAVARHAPAAVIHNYYPSTMRWLRRGLLRRFHVPHLGIMHEVTQDKADAASGALFDLHVAPDPTLLLRNPRVVKTGRLVLGYDNRLPAPAVPTIGSFGFGLAGKGFAELIDRVQAEFDEAVVRLHVPFAAYGDADGAGAREIARACAQRVTKPGIRLQVTHDFLTQDGLLDFLAQNTVNAFFYAEQQGRGIASVTDHALAVRRPIAVTRSSMFRHITSAAPSACIDQCSLKEIIARGAQALDRIRAEWCAENLVWDYERAVDAALATPRATLRQVAMQRVGAWLGRRRAAGKGGDWTPGTVGAVAAPASAAADPYLPPDLGDLRLNRILDDEARAVYRPAIAYLESRLPEMIQRKIPAANVQQAFVLDTVVRLAAARAQPSILCIGSFDDTAAAGLRLAGLPLDEIDPVLNYDLATYLTRPTCRRGGYDIVFATSVLEHVRDDVRFLADIAALLRPDGMAVLTCDYHDAYRPGDPHPPEDFRLYTQRDFRQRLLPAVPALELADQPQWDCPEPDFSYHGVRYTFATLVLRRGSAGAAATPEGSALAAHAAPPLPTLSGAGQPR